MTQPVMKEYCKTRFVYVLGHAREPTLDHKVPLSRGGTHSQDNLVAACRRCNNEKYTKTADEFFQHRERRRVV